MHDYLLFLLGLTPLLAMIILILKVKMPIHYAVLSTLFITLILGGFFWNTPVQDMGFAVVYGAIKGLWPIVIVILAAIYSYNLMNATKSMDILRNVLASVSDDKRIQVLLILWCFGGFLEAAAGYGTAVAIPIGILIALGFNPLKAAIASLVANTVPTAFGAVGIPVSVLAEQVNLPVTTQRDNYSSTGTVQHSASFRHRRDYRWWYEDYTRRWTNYPDVWCQYINSPVSGGC